MAQSNAFCPRLWRSNPKTTQQKQKRQQWGPKGSTALASQFAGASVQATVTFDPDCDLHREIYQLRAMPAPTSQYGSSSVVLPTTAPVQH
jgi:hypothetical protein